MTIFWLVVFKPLRYWALKLNSINKKCFSRVIEGFYIRYILLMNESDNNNAETWKLFH